MEIRLNKFISDSGICSRREADRLIEEGRVAVNGRAARMGQKVTENDRVSVDDVAVKPSRRLFGATTSRKPSDEAEASLNRKSAALRKTSRNNPLNKSRRKAEARNQTNEEYDWETHRTGNRRATFGKK